MRSTLTYSVSLSRLLIRHSTQKTSVIGIKRFQDVLSLLYSSYIACYRAGKIELVALSEAMRGS